MFSDVRPEAPDEVGNTIIERNERQIIIVDEFLVMWLEPGPEGNQVQVLPGLNCSPAVTVAAGLSISSCQPDGINPQLRVRDSEFQY